MVKITITACLLTLSILASLCASSQDLAVTAMAGKETDPGTFDKFFTGKSLRVDYILAGNDRITQCYLWQIKEEPFWGGPRKNLIDPWNSGNFRYSAIDSATGELLFRMGCSTLFEEFQGTQEARIVQRAYPMTALLPYPVRTIRFTIERRTYETGRFDSLFGLFINPADPFILHEMPDRYPVFELETKGSTAHQLDIAFVAEGYTEEEMPEFREDVRRISEYFLAAEPFSGFRERITFRAVESPSEGSGVDIPGTNTYVNTSISSSFYTFGSERYLTTKDTWSMRDIAANVPYDQIIILNNSTKYGGGGFYNHYCQSTTDNEWSEIVAIHEFGHAFGGLADEYVGGVNYDGYYNLKLEPWEPNITTRIDFGSKWLRMIPDTVPVPTPRDSAYLHIVGVFEGGGYIAKGIYSPVMNCRMKDDSAPGFCPVCQEAIRQKILFYCD
jgi:hypothetical protein